jgi:hypothetical protein
MDKELNNELYAKMKASLSQFCFDLKELIHKGTYDLHYLYRDASGKVNTVHMNVGDTRIILRADEWSVNMPVEGNPVNPELLDNWDRQQIDWEINYHQEQLELLKKRKEELK